MTVEDQPVLKWSREVPGTRWFRADLHLHTPDDPRFAWPASIAGDRNDPTALRAFARLFLQTAASLDIQVLGLTPHRPRTENSSSAPSAAWAIVDAWQTEEDDDGVPFREKIFAVFPGFEPNLNDGKSGVHVLFLFDPSIGPDHYQRAYERVYPHGNFYGGDGTELALSSSDTRKVLDELDAFRGGANPPFDYLAIGAHVETDKGVFGALKEHARE